MPLYDYQCSACERIFEAEHPMSARPRLRCQYCGSTRTSKLFNAAGVQFRGSGFYVTDSRGSEPATAGSAKEAVRPSESKPASEPAAAAG